MIRVTHGAAWAAVLLAIGFPATSEAADLLPDLDQAAPSQVMTNVKDGKFVLGFKSAVRNAGAGPLIIDAARADTSVPEMTARQRVQTGATFSDNELRGIVGTVYYDTDHGHWHFRHFDRYQLRAGPPSRPAVAPDEKTGFCLGDRYDADPSRPGGPIFDVPSVDEWNWHYCMYGHPEAVRVVEGISPGWGDSYDAFLEGQQIDVTGLPAGTYDLVHTVNVEHAIEESDYSNNSASAEIRLSWPNGTSQKPSATVVRTCPDTDHCIPDGGDEEQSTAQNHDPTPEVIPPSDRTAPRVSIAAARVQRLARSGRVNLYATCSERCFLKVGGTLAFPALSRSLPVRTHAEALIAGRSVRFPLVLSNRARARAASYLRRHGRPKLSISITAADLSGNVTARKRTVYLAR